MGPFLCVCVCVCAIVCVKANQIQIRSDCQSPNSKLMLLRSLSRSLALSPLFTAFEAFEGADGAGSCSHHLLALAHDDDDDDDEDNYRLRWSSKPKLKLKPNRAEPNRAERHQQSGTPSSFGDGRAEGNHLVSFGRFSFGW